MSEILNQLQGLDPDQASVVLFGTLLVVCTGAAVLVAVLRAMGKWGTVALCVATAVVAIAYRGM